MARAPLWTPETAEEIEAADELTNKDELDEDATAADLIAANTTIKWVWPNWIQAGVLTALAASPGVGKTRFLADILATVWNGKPTWPDGSPNTLPPGGKVIWVAADNQHAELGGFPAEFGFDPAALVLNASRRNPFGGTMLDAVEDLVEFERRIKRVNPVFVFIDTTTNTTDRNGNEAKEAKAYYKPLQEIAQRCDVAIICVVHLNADGKPLGRRVEGQVRGVISMTRPDPDGQPHRRKLQVTKSNSLHPRPLGVTMGTGGNTYDFHPPEPPPEEKPAGRGGKKASPQLKECTAWLEGILSGQRVIMVGETRKLADAEGYSAGTLYDAKAALGLEDGEIGSRKVWKLPLGEDDAPPLEAF